MVDLTMLFGVHVFKIIFQFFLFFFSRRNVAYYLSKVIRTPASSSPLHVPVLISNIRCPPIRFCSHVRDFINVVINFWFQDHTYPDPLVSGRLLSGTLITSRHGPKNFSFSFLKWKKNKEEEEKKNRKTTKKKSISIFSKLNDWNVIEIKNPVFLM